MNEITINTTIEVPTVVVKTITRAVTTFLGSALEKNFALLAFEYLDTDGSVAKKRFFKVSGTVYDQHVDTVINGQTYRQWTKAEADAFAMSLINDPTLIDGMSVKELIGGQFMNEIITNVVK